MGKSKKSAAIVTKLLVKIGRVYLNLTTYEDPDLPPKIGIGTKAPIPLKLFLYQQSKNVRRAVRKAISAAGFPNIAAESVPAKLKPLLGPKSSINGMRERGYTDQELREQDSWMR